MPAPRAARLLVAIALGLPALALPAAPATAAPVTVNYPSVECPDTGDEGLQQCIDSIDAGSTVILVDEIIDEGAQIDKSLTLRAVDRSLRPVLLGIAVNSPPAGKVDVTVEDIRFTLGLFVNLLTGSGHTVTIRRVEVGKNAPFPVGVSVWAEVPASFTLEDSFIRSDQEDQQSVVGLLAQHPNGLVRFRIVGNRITARGDTESSSGIDLAMEGNGSVEADIYNNAIWDVATCNCGAASGIAILPSKKTRASVNIVGNTIEKTKGAGIQQRNGMTTGRLSLDVFNNIVSHNGFGGISLDSGKPGSLVFRAGFNNYFANTNGNNFDGQSPGPGNLHVNPRYVDPAKRDFRLRANSPLINKGLTCSPGGVANPDAAGRHRLNGRSVDIGAYERGAAKITGVVLLGKSGRDQLIGTKGRDILCGYGGPDELHGRGGADFIDGGPGADRLFGDGGKDRVFGNTGNDVLCMRDGKGGDIVDGGPGTDTAKTDAGDTRISIEGSGGDCAL